jgi:hypothetical protein
MASSRKSTCKLPPAISWIAFFPALLGQGQILLCAGAGDGLGGATDAPGSS